MLAVIYNFSFLSHVLDFLIAIQLLSAFFCACVWLKLLEIHSHIHSEGIQPNGYLFLSHLVDLGLYFLYICEPVVIFILHNTEEVYRH